MEEGPIEVKLPRAHKSPNVAPSPFRERRAEAKPKELLGFAEVSCLSCAWHPFGCPRRVSDRSQNVYKRLK